MNKQSQFWVNQLVKRSAPDPLFLQNPEEGYITPSGRIYTEEHLNNPDEYALYHEPRKDLKGYLRNAGRSAALGGIGAGILGAGIGLPGLRRSTALGAGAIGAGIGALSSLLNRYGDPEIEVEGDAQTVANALADRIRQVGPLG